MPWLVGINPCKAFCSLTNHLWRLVMRGRFYTPMLLTALYPTNIYNRPPINRFWYAPKIDHRIWSNYYNRPPSVSYNELQKFDFSGQTFITDHDRSVIMPFKIFDQLVKHYNRSTMAGYKFTRGGCVHVAPKDPEQQVFATGKTDHQDGRF